MEEKPPPTPHYVPPPAPPPPYSSIANPGYQQNQVGVLQPGPTVAFLHPQPPQVLINANVSMLGPLPCQIKCPACQATVITRITSMPGGMAWLIGLGLCLVGYVNSDTF